MLLQRSKAWIARNGSRLPLGVSRALMGLGGHGLVYGRDYLRHQRLLRATERAYDNTGDLLRAANHAIANVPYYRDRYGGRVLRSVAELEATIGFIDRDIVAADPDGFVDPAIDRRDYESCTTGGTSGKPLTFLAPRRRYVVELATMHSLWERAGFRFDVRAVIRNHKLPDDQPYAINPITREVIFDGFRLGEEQFGRIASVISQLGIRFVHCYPSTAYELARYLQKHGNVGIEAFLSGSENVFPFQRSLIEDELGIRFYNWYGHSEKLVLAGYCASTRDYHVEPTYGYCELVDERGAVVREPGAVGEIVGTSFHNPGMPFLRYRTGDFAEYAGHGCKACGRAVPLFRNVRGRWSGERIYKADGTFVTTTALNLHDGINRVLLGLQYIQERIGALTVLVVKSPEFTARDEALLREHLQTKLGAGTDVEIRPVERLLRHPNGKFSLLVSSVRT